MNQSLTAKVALEEERLGSWPRRLYHVSTKTSYEWKEGNRYGEQGLEHIEPQYSILTYTWGRWRLKEIPVKEKRELYAIPVEQVPWDIPCVEPKHFTRDDFLRVLETMTIDYEASRHRWIPDKDAQEYVYKSVPEEHDVEFVWFDVACLDQRPDSATMDSEKGRQVAIFSKAKKAFAWLSTQELLDLQTMDMLLEAFRDTLDGIKLGLGYEAFDIWTRILRDKLQTFLEDPWFTSLWALQESFLRSDAVFLSREGKTVRLDIWPDVPKMLKDKHWMLDDLPAYVLPYELSNFDDSNSVEARNPSQIPFGVHDLVDLCQRMTVWSARTSAVPTQAWEDIMELWRKVGIAQIASGNLFAISVAAARRKCTRSEDRIYGIQQLFQLRLGNTAVGKAGQKFTQDQLQDELTTTLLKTQPALSQMHVFSTPVALGNAWKMNESSVFPTMTLEKFFRIWSSKEIVSRATGSSGALNMRREKLEKEDSYMRSEGYEEPFTKQTCHFEVVKTTSGKWARFKGYTTPFSRLISTCYEEEGRLCEDIGPGPRGDFASGYPKAFSFKIFLDVSNETIPGVDPSLLTDRYDDKYGAYGLRGIEGGKLLMSISSLERQEKLAMQLSKAFNDSDELVVLEMLTSFGDPFWSYYGNSLGPYRSTYGLLLQRKVDQECRCYRRLGYCYWEDYSHSQQRDMSPLKWSFCNDIFG